MESPDGASAEVRSLLETARSPDHPADWFVWPLRREVVRRAAFGWTFTTVVGFALLVPVFLATVPSNFVGGDAGLVLFTIVLLLILGTVAFGGLGLLIADLFRLAQWERYLLVMTPTDYIKASPRQITHVPMESVAYVTLKGVKLPPVPGTERPSAVSVMASRFGFGGTVPGTYRREFRRPPTLAFQDKRTQKTVMVATDDSFDQLPVLDEILSLYAGNAARARSRAR